MLKADVPLASALSDICPISFDPEELQREQGDIVQEIGASEDSPTIWCSSSCRRRVAGPADRALDPGQARDGARLRPQTAGALPQAQLPRPTCWWRRPARSIIARSWPRSRRFARLRRTGRPHPGAGAVRGQLAYCRNARPRAGSRGAGDARAAPARSPRCSACGSSPRRRSTYILAPVQEGALITRPLLFHLRVSAPYSDTGMFGLYARHQNSADLPELMRVVVGEIENASLTLAKRRLGAPRCR